MKRHLLKKEWETYIQDYKNSGLSNIIEKIFIKKVRKHNLFFTTGTGCINSIQ
ncbi:hypothetical protein [Bacillus pseudomycoides]|uniref:hypothetical protein n=1 Tax=Bacillus pseudomycoides TaxID=64104 RepID=UPI003399E8CC